MREGLFWLAYSHNKSPIAQHKLNRWDFIQYLARENGMTPEDAEAAYDMVINGIKKAVCSGAELSLMGFGRFYLSVHKGHPTQFDRSRKNTAVKDYVVFRFAPSQVLSKEIRQCVELEDGDKAAASAGKGRAK